MTYRRCPYCHNLTLEVNYHRESVECLDCGYTGKCAVCDGDVADPPDDPEFCSNFCAIEDAKQREAEAMMDDRR